MLTDLPDISLDAKQCDCDWLQRENQLLLVLAKCERFLREEEEFFADQIIRAQAFDLVRSGSLLTHATDGGGGDDY
jgi:hypothetical protein